MLQFALYVNSCSRKLSLLLCTSHDIVLRDVWFAPGELWYTCTCMNGSQTQVVSLFCWVRVFFCCFWLILKSIFIKWDWCQYIDVKTILMLPFPTWSSTNILSLPSLIQRCSISGGSNKEIWVSVANVLIKVLTVIVWTTHFLICYISIIKKTKTKGVHTRYILSIPQCIILEILETVNDSTYDFWLSIFGNFSENLHCGKISKMNPPLTMVQVSSICLKAKFCKINRIYGEIALAFGLI